MIQGAAARTRGGGFTLVELLVTVAVVALLVLTAVPAFRTLERDRRVATITALVDRLEDAVRLHHEHTGRLARELSGASRRGTGWHTLSMTQSYAGWQGPYIEGPLGAEQNPFGGEVELHDRLAGELGRPHRGEFRPAGPEGPRASGAGQMLVLTRIPEAIAREVDRDLDGDLPGDWRVDGRVQWRPMAEGALMVLLLDV